MRSRFFQYVSLFLAAACPLSLMAADAGVIAFPNGGAAMNGTPLTRPTPVASGDIISTSDGYVAMSIGGSKVQVGRESSMTFAPDQLTVSRGGVKIVTRSGLPARVEYLTVRPDPNIASVYTVAERYGKIMIAALQGRLVLRDNTMKQVVVESGHAISIALQNTAVPAPATPNSQAAGAQPENCKPDDKKCQQEAAAKAEACKRDKTKCPPTTAGGAAGTTGAAGGAGAPGAGLSTAAIAGIATGAAAAAAGVAAGMVGGPSQNASPTKP